jgi:short chain dehydrogenase
MAKLGERVQRDEAPIWLELAAGLGLTPESRRPRRSLDLPFIPGPASRVRPSVLRNCCCCRVAASSKIRPPRQGRRSCSATSRKKRWPKHGEGGQIVSTASIAGLISGGNPIYSVSKYGVVALSEGLRGTLAPRGIGVSVLYPGFIRTQITNSRRNVPQRFAGTIMNAPLQGPRVELVRERVANGIDPLYVGELVREGIENDWPYIFTDTEFEPVIDNRFAAIKQGFDRIRRRQPRH